MHRHALLGLALVLGCASGSPSRETAATTPLQSVSAAALMEALRDTSPPTRVYLPQEVAKPAEALDEPDMRIGALRTAVEASERLAAIRGVVDTLGEAERATLTVLPGSDPREGSLLLRRATNARWRPARLATGRAVRQLFEWRFCRSGPASCIRFEPDPIERAVPHVSAP